MSMGQVAISELRKRVGKVDPVTGFRLIDDIIKEREQAIAMFEQMAMGWAYDLGRLTAFAEGTWNGGAYVEQDFAVDCLYDVLKVVRGDFTLLSQPPAPDLGSKLVLLSGTVP